MRQEEEGMKVCLLAKKMKAAQDSAQRCLWAGSVALKCAEGQQSDCRPHRRNVAVEGPWWATP